MLIRTISNSTCITFYQSARRTVNLQSTSRSRSASPGPLCSQVEFVRTSRFKSETQPQHVSVVIWARGVVLSTGVWPRRDSWPRPTRTSSVASYPAHNSSRSSAAAVRGDHRRALAEGVVGGGDGFVGRVGHGLFPVQRVVGGGAIAERVLDGDLLPVDVVGERGAVAELVEGGDGLAGGPVDGCVTVRAGIDGGDTATGSVEERKSASTSRKGHFYVKFAFGSRLSPCQCCVLLTATTGRNL